MIYLDNAATTEIKSGALEAMVGCMKEQFANPSAVYREAGKARRALYEARKSIADEIDADEEEIFFTSGGTESDNLAILGVAKALSGKGRHIITSAIEHHAVLRPCEELEHNGFSVTYIKPGEDGVITPESLEAAIRPDTIFISIMLANNETGVLQPIEELSKIAGKHKIIFHTDAVQALGHMDISVKRLGCSLLSATAHKCGGPRGTGILYIKRGTPINPVTYGGGQEDGIRPGTENVAGAVGFAKALADKEDTEKVLKMRDYLLERVENGLSGVHINGTMEKRLPGNLNLSFDGVRGEALLMRLSSKDICVSTGSACTSGSGEASHVLRAMGLSDERCNGSLRITLSDRNTMEEMDFTAEQIIFAVNELRRVLAAS